MKRLVLAAILAGASVAQPPLLTPLAPPSADTVVATVDGNKVTVGDVSKWLEVLPQTFAVALKQNPQAAIQQYYILRYLAAEGKKLKLEEQSPLKEQLEMYV